MANITSIFARLSQYQRERDAVTHQAIPILAVFMVVGYTFFAAGHLVFLPPDQALVMAGLAAATALIALATYILFRRGVLATRYANATMMVASALLFLNSGVHIWVTGDTKHVINLGTAVMCLGLLHLSVVYIAASYVVMAAAWLWLARPLMDGGETAHYAFFLFSCTVVAAIAFTIRWIAFTRAIALKHKADAREAELREALVRARLAEEAERDSRAKSEFLSNMSHELRTPLNAIIGFSEVIKNQLMGPIGVAVYAEYAEDIHNSGASLLRMLNDILEIARVDVRTAAAEETDCALEELFARVIGLVSGRGNGPLLTISSRIGPRVAVVRCDELRLKRTLMHLMSNAVKFTPPGGRVLLEAQLEENDGGPNQVVFTVTDTGRGMAQDEIERAFHAFWQSKQAYMSDQGGAGLGLPLAREFARQMGGDLTLTTEPGRGLCARLALPAGRLLPRFAGSPAARVDDADREPVKAGARFG